MKLKSKMLLGLACVAMAFGTTVLFKPAEKADIKTPANNATTPYQPCWVEEGVVNTSLNYVPDDEINNVTQKSWGYSFTNDLNKDVLVKLNSYPATDNVEITYGYDDEKLTDANLADEQFSTSQDRLVGVGETQYVYIIAKVISTDQSASYTEKVAWEVGEALELTIDLGDGSTVPGYVIKGVKTGEISILETTDKNIDGLYQDDEYINEIDMSTPKTFYRSATLYAMYSNLPDDWLDEVDEDGDGIAEYYKVVKPADAAADDLPANLVIPTKYNDGTHGSAPVTTIVSTGSSNSAFGSQNITSVTIPRTITDMGTHTFYNNTTLQTIKFRANSQLTAIGNSTLYGCTSLNSVTIPSSVTSIGSTAFSGCTSLSGELHIPNSVTSIGTQAFNNCGQLTAVHITDLSAWCRISFGSPGASYANLGTNPLYYAKNLYLNNILVTEVAFPEGVTEIKPYIFQNCTNLTKVTIPSSVTSVGDGAFKSCDNLAKYEYDNAYYLGNDNDPYMILWKKKTTSTTSCQIHSTTRFIHSEAFQGCTSLTNITIPDSVTGIGLLAFYNCIHLTSITIPDSVISIGARAFWYCSRLTSVTIRSGVTSIGAQAFEYCSSIATITIPDSVTSIGSDAFSDCTSLTGITIGSGVTSMGYRAFENCTRLTTMTIYAIKPPTLGNNTFYGGKVPTTIYIPKGSLSAYSAAANWKDYSSKFVEMD